MFFQGERGDPGRRGPRGGRGTCGAKGEAGDIGTPGEPVRLTVYTSREISDRLIKKEIVLKKRKHIILSSSGDFSRIRTLLKSYWDLIEYKG